MWKYICYSIGFTLGAVLVLGGAFFLQSMPELFASKIHANLPIVPGTDAYTRYTNSSVPLEVKMYMFNVTNPEEVRTKGVKPILQQVGPFSFTERRRKSVLGFSKDNFTLDYRLVRTYFFKPEESIPLSSVITLPNVPAFSAAFSANSKAIENEDSIVNFREVLRTYLVNETMYSTHTADTWLFKGVKIDFLEAMADDGITVDDPPKDNKFGFYYKKNDTWDEKSDGTMTISTGADGNFADIGRVKKWNGKSELSFWKSSCNILKGTDGQFFHPFIQKDEVLNIFAPDLCRTLAIEFNRTVFLRTIELYRFSIASSFFKPINADSNTECYCVKKEHSSRQTFCKLKGVVDASKCRNKPIVLSTPHFYNGDPFLLTQVDGLSPNATEHDTFIDVEPMTGAVMRVRRRLQVNVEMSRNNNFEASKNITSRGIIHPFIWLDQSIVIPDDLAQKFENKLTKVVRMVKIICYAALIVGPLILMATLIYICSDIRSEDKKLRGKKNSSNVGKEYEKVHVVMKKLSSKTGGDVKE